ncbi:hypothetical protein EIL50_04035 [bacterium NHP-B]|nr:hypothetical protein EIL50_04035 [bacterium NHP-B]
MYIVLFLCVCLSSSLSLFATKRTFDKVSNLHPEMLAEPSSKKRSAPSECLQKESTAHGLSCEIRQYQGRSPIEMLPAEMLDKIIDLAIEDSTDVKNITSTCKRFRDIVHARVLPYRKFLDIHLDNVSENSFIPLAPWQLMWNKSSQDMMKKISYLSTILAQKKHPLKKLNLFYSPGILYHDEGISELLSSIDKVSENAPFFLNGLTSFEMWEVSFTESESSGIERGQKLRCLNNILSKMPLLKRLSFESTELSDASFYPLETFRSYLDAMRTLGETIKNKPLELLSIDANVDDRKSHDNKWQEQTLFFHMGDFFPKTLRSLEVRDIYMAPQNALFERRDQLVELILQSALLDKDLLLKKIPFMEKLKTLTIVDCFSYEQDSRPLFHTRGSHPFSMTLREWFTLLPPHIESMTFSGNRIRGMGGDVSEVKLPSSLATLILQDCINNGKVLLALGSKMADIKNLDVSSWVYKKNSGLTVQHVKTFLAQFRPHTRQLSVGYNHILLKEVHEVIAIHLGVIFLKEAHLQSLDIGAFAPEGVDEVTRNVLCTLAEKANVKLSGLPGHG